MEKLQYVIGVVAVLIFAFLAFDYKESGKDIPPNIQLLLSVIFAAILARGSVSAENAKVLKEKLLGEKPTESKDGEVIKDDGTAKPAETKPTSGP